MDTNLLPGSGRQDTQTSHWFHHPPVLNPGSRLFSFISFSSAQGAFLSLQGWVFYHTFVPWVISLKWSPLNFLWLTSRPRGLQYSVLQFLPSVCSAIFSVSPRCGISCPVTIQSFSHGTHVLCRHTPCVYSVPSPYALSGITVHLFIAFAKHLTSPRKRYRKTVQKKKKPTHSQNRLNPCVCSPFHQTACWQKFTSLFTGMLFLAAGILGTSQQLDFVQTYIHMISLCSHIWTFPRWSCWRMFSLMVISYWLTFQRANRFVSYSSGCSQIFCLALKNLLCDLMISVKHPGFFCTSCC